MKNEDESIIIKHFIEKKIHYSTIIGNSMYPMLRDRKDRVVIKPLEKSVKLLDVVFYKRPLGSIILHRVVGIGRNHYYICGDNQYMIEKVEKELILGKLYSFYRGDDYCKTDNLYYRIYSILYWILLPVRIPVLFLKNKLTKKRKFFT